MAMHAIRKIDGVTSVKAQPNGKDGGHAENVRQFEVESQADKDVRQEIAPQRERCISLVP